MIQEILTYAVIIFAFGFTAYRFVKMIIPSKEISKGGCTSCASSSSCSAPKMAVRKY